MQELVQEDLVQEGLVREDLVREDLVRVQELDLVRNAQKLHTTMNALSCKNKWIIVRCLRVP